jgi:hypothetical protein
MNVVTAKPTLAAYQYDMVEYHTKYEANDVWMLSEHLIKEKTNIFQLKI